MWGGGGLEGGGNAGWTKHLGPGQLSWLVAFPVQLDPGAHPALSFLDLGRLFKVESIVARLGNSVFGK